MSTHPSEWTSGTVIVHPDGTRRTLLSPWGSDRVHPGWTFREDSEGLAIWQLVMSEWQPDSDARLPLSVRETLRVARRYAICRHGMTLDMVDRAEQWIVDTMRIAYLADEVRQ